MSSPSYTPVKLIPRPFSTRGHADHGWLKTYHTFNFASWQSEDPLHSKWGSLRVINEDRVEPSEGFGTHGHREFEIFSYVVNGDLQHRDSLNNLEVMKRGDIQMTSTGTGIRHSEYNDSSQKQVHFLQIWAKPSTPGLKPSYYTRHFSDEDKLNNLVKVVAPVSESIDEREGSGPAPIHSPLRMFASILEPSKSLVHDFGPNVKKGYLHLIQTSGYVAPRRPAREGGAVLKVKSGGTEHTLEEGDGIYVDEVREKSNIEFESVGKEGAEFVFFELE